MAPNDWKAWLELTLLVAVTLLALGRWIFGRERDSEEGARQRTRVHGLASDLSRLSLQVAALEERIDAARDRLDSLEDTRRERRPNNRRPDRP